MTKTKTPYDTANQLALTFIDKISSSCKVVERAGSLRRKKLEVGDIEIVAIPKLNLDMFSNPTSLIPTKLDDCLDDLISSGFIELGNKNGPRQKQLFLSSVQVDLFIVIDETWPVQFAIRTGPALFSKKIVTPLNKGGLLRNGLKIHQGRVWSNDKALMIDTEVQFFEECLICGWVFPEERETYLGGRH